MKKRRTATWPVLLLCLPAFVAIWGGWVGLGERTGFGVINLLPGMVANGGWATFNTAITLPIGLETYAAYALHAYLNATQRGPLRRFAGWSALSALILGGAGQVGYHVMEAQGIDRAPIWVTALVGSLPVLVLGLGTTLGALIRRDAAGVDPEEGPAPTLAERVRSLKAQATEVRDALRTPAADPIGAEPAPYLAEVPFGPDPLPAPVSPAPVPRQRRTRGSWDPVKAVRLILEGDLTDAKIAETVGIGPKVIQRTRRAVDAIKVDRHVTIPREWKVSADVVDVIRREVRP